ncbi:hypothetical protein ACP70R_013931 [Stipagrostis hirtigluma subsp. patula]
MSPEQEEIPVASAGEQAAGIRGAIRKKQCRGRKKAAQDPSASSYGDVPFEKVDGGSLADVSSLNEAAVGRSVVMLCEVQAIRLVSNTMAVVMLQFHLITTVRGVVVAGAFEGITTRMVRFATTLRKQSMVVVDGVVSLARRTSTSHQVEIQVKKLHSINFDMNSPIKVKDAVRSNEELQKAEQVCPMCRGTGIRERAPGA